MVLRVMEPGRRQCLQRVAGLGLVGAAALAAAWPASALASARGGEGAVPLRWQLRFNLTMRNPTGVPLENQTVWVYLPLHDTATQHLAGVKVSAAHELSRDELGHCLLRLSLPSVGPFASKIVAVQTDVEVSPEPRGTVLKSPADWLKAERWIECEDADLRALAATLQQASPRLTLDAIYDWVSTQLKYAGYLADPMGARQAFQQRTGDCTEYAFLCTALARINGIPARPMGGYVVSGSAAPRAEDYHDWTEVYLDGAWRVMDAQKGRWGPGNEDYIAFRIHRAVASNALGLAARFKVDGGLELRM